MNFSTGIEWTDATVNPVRFRDRDGRDVWACIKESPGCAHCYAEALAKRYGRGGPFTRATMDGLTPYLSTKELRAMLRSRKIAGKRVFVCDMTDLFGPWVPDEMIAAVFGVMAARPDVTWQVLTKHAARMAAWCEWAAEHGPACGVSVAAAFADLYSHEINNPPWGAPWPLPNVWLGVSAEDQRRADERIPHLLRCPAAVRWVSLEPLLGPVDLYEYFQRHDVEWAPPTGPGIDWVVVGGESGANARPCDLGAVRSVVRQCREAGVPVFVKQLGAAASDPVNGVAGSALRVNDTASDLITLRLRDRKGGDPAEWPEDLRVREMPRGDHAQPVGPPFLHQ